MRKERSNASCCAFLCTAHFPLKCMEKVKCPSSQWGPGLFQVRKIAIVENVFVLKAHRTHPVGMYKSQGSLSGGYSLLGTRMFFTRKLFFLAIIPTGPLVPIQVPSAPWVGKGSAPPNEIVGLNRRRRLRGRGGSKQWHRLFSMHSKISEFSHRILPPIL